MSGIDITSNHLRVKKLHSMLSFEGGVQPWNAMVIMFRNSNVNL